MIQLFNKYNKIFLAVGLIAVIIVIGFLVYNTYSNYKSGITEKPTGLPEVLSPVQSTSPEFVYQGGSGVIEKPLTEKSILMVVSFKDFQDEEYFISKQNFLAAGVKSVLTASNQIGTAVGTDGGEVTINLLLKNINVVDFDAIVFIGGPGALKYLDNDNVYRIAKDAAKEGKLLSAISVAPAILAKSGVLEGKKATVWNSPADQSEVKILEDNGVIFQDRAVVRDGKIITGKGSESSDDFSMEIIDFLMQ